MVIRELTREECLRVLAGPRLARLACASMNQPYVVPVYLAYHQSPDDHSCFYGFTTHGQKVEWMRSNPLVCVQLDEIASIDQWVSVIVFGRYEELPDTSASNIGRRPALEIMGEHFFEAAPHVAAQDSELRFAHEVLSARAMWWEPAATARAAGTHQGQYQPIFYKILIDQVTGHEATQEPVR